MSLLEQNITKKEGVEKIPELNVGNENSKKYKLESILNSAVYAKKSESHLPKLYYLIALKSYLEEEST